MAGKNSKKVNNKQSKRKENKEKLTKDRIWKVVGAFDSACLNCLETKYESRRKREEDVELNWMSSIKRRRRRRRDRKRGDAIFFFPALLMNRKAQRFPISHMGTPHD